MNYSIIFYIIGWILNLEAAFMFPSCIVAVIYGEKDGWAILAAVLLCLLIGLPLVRKKPQNRVFYLREGFVSTALSWLVMSCFGAIPFVISGWIKNPVDALFEVVSGFTTTGASILADVEALPRCLLFWRSFTHWIGGMGVLVFLLTLLPLAGGSHMNLMKAESPGPSVSRLVPKVKSTAKILYLIYIVMTVTEIILLLIGKMPLFDALTLSFGTAGTGGFGIRNDSIAGYSVYCQVVITIFMILVITWNIRGMFDSIGQAFQQSAFQVASIITTTGYATTDFNLWPQVSRTILVMLMFVGACAGSTGGGIKVSRFLILMKAAKKELIQLLHPRSVRKIKIDGKAVEHEVVRSTNVFMGIYVLVFAFSILLIAFDNLDLATNFTAVTATLNNIGPGLELVGPTGNFSVFSDFSKLVLTFDMPAGRLELFPLLLLFVPDTWKKF